MGFYVTVANGVYNYVEDLNPAGRITILFLHGWPGSHGLFEYQFDQLPKLGFRCVGIDTRGFGRSARPWDGYDYNTLSDDVRAVMDAMQLENVVLAGHSTGGAIAVRYMARHRGHGVGKLVLMAAAAPSLIQRPYFPYGLPKQAVLDIIGETQTDRPSMLRGFGNMIFHNYVTPGISDWIYGLGLEAAGWATAAIANTWLDEEGLFEDLETLQVPTLILHGLDDKVCLFPLGEAQKKAIKNAELIALESCGHFLFYDQQERVNRELAEFAKG